MPSLHSCSGLMGYCFSQLIYRRRDSGVWLAHRWQNESPPTGRNGHWFNWRAAPDLLNRLTKISMWLAIHKSWIRLVRCARNYNHTSLRKIPHKREESGIGPRANAASMVSPTGIHCASAPFRYFLPYEPKGFVCRKRSRIHNGLGYRKRNDRFMSKGTHVLRARLCVHKCASFFLRPPICSWMWSWGANI